MPAWIWPSITETLLLARLRRAPSPGWMRSLRLALFLLCAIPAVLLVSGLLRGELGVNPVEKLLLESGLWALRFLLITLAITPLRWLTGVAWLVQLRRQLGLWAFFYAASHFSVYAVFENSLVLSSILADIIKRPFILVGMAALLMLLPLALTSTKGWIKRLGRRWKQLHWLIYPAALLGLTHFFWIIRANRWAEPVAYAVILAVLLGWRVQKRWRPSL